VDRKQETHKPTLFEMSNPPFTFTTGCSSTRTVSSQLGSPLVAQQARWTRSRRCSSHFAGDPSSGMRAAGLSCWKGRKQQKVPGVCFDPFASPSRCPSGTLFNLLGALLESSAQMDKARISKHVREFVHIPKEFLQREVLTRLPSTLPKFRVSDEARRRAGGLRSPERDSPDVHRILQRSQRSALIKVPLLQQLDIKLRAQHAQQQPFGLLQHRVLGSLTSRREILPLAVVVARGISAGMMRVLSRTREGGFSSKSLVMGLRLQDLVGTGRRRRCWRGEGK
jgi:hypothetical protein